LWYERRHEQARAIREQFMRRRDAIAVFAVKVKPLREP
jgi:hypothetical protein